MRCKSEGENVMDEETPPPPDLACCSFCGRRSDQVTKIVLESENARICDVCIRQCNEIITAEEIEN